MLGIFGGTFDPVHFGHLRPALELAEALRLDEMRLLPAGRPPHRDPPVAPPEARRHMVELAIEPEPTLQLDDRELRRPGPSWMVDTLTELRAEVGDRPLLLVVGSDAVASLHHWHRWRELFRLAHLVVAGRPGWEPSPQAPAWAELEERRLASAEALAERPAGGVLFRAVTPLEISSTAIRRLLAEGGNPRYLLPETVLQWIRRHRIYDRPGQPASGTAGQEGR